MRDKIFSAIEELSHITNETEAHLHSVAIYRLLMQHCCYPILEWVHNAQQIFPVANSVLDASVQQLLKPTDGDLIDCLSDLLVRADQLGWTGMSEVLYAAVNTSRPASRFCTSRKKNLHCALIGFVQLRNDDVMGHGLPGSYDIESELDLIQLLYERTREFLPTIRENRYWLESTVKIGDMRLELLRPDEGSPVLIRDIIQSKSGKCTVNAQSFVKLGVKRTFKYDSEDIIGKVLSSGMQSYEIFQSGVEGWKPLCLLPARITDQFVGRNELIETLKDWSDDELSRCCMLYGDGGYGKTTLVVEYMHQLLEGKISQKWHPEMITFFTAKKTAWGLDGLVMLKNSEQRISNFVQEVYGNMEGGLPGKEWYNKTPAQLIDKLSTYLYQGFGVDRDNHLVILDNTETLTQSQHEVDDLAELVRKISRSIGKVLLTTRRREPLEARQVHVGPLSVDESIAMIDAKSKKFEIGQLSQAGPATKRKVSRELGFRPLAIDVFCRALITEKSSVDAALARVKRMMRHDLGEFLYADAWSRLEPSIQHIMLAMARISSVHDETMLKIVCDECGVSVWHAQQALDESEGIATMNVVGNTAQIYLSQGFMEYCEDRTIEIQGKQQPTEQKIYRIRKLYQDFLRIRSATVKDRMGPAFRHPYAKAAWDCFKRGDYEKCQFYYEQAINEDKDNAYLWDRYAFFLYTKVNDTSRALAATARSVALAHDDKECWFTRGMILGRSGDIEKAVASLEKSRKYGKEPHLVEIQLAHAYLNDKPSNKAAARQHIEKAEEILKEGIPFYGKLKHELSRLKDRAH